MGDIRTTEGQTPPLTIKQKKSLKLKIICLIILFAAAIISVGITVKMDRYVSATGYVTTRDYAEVRPAVTGRVEEILVGSGDIVTRGQVLVKLSRSEEQANLAQAKSQVRQLEAEFTRREAEIAEARRQHSLSIAESQFVLDDLKRTIARLTAALAGEHTNEGELSVELASLRAARDNVQRASAVLARREAEIAEARETLKWDIQQGEIVLENARSEAARTAQLVDSKLASGRALDEARLKEKLAEVALNALKGRDPTIFDKELAVLQQDLKSRESAVVEAEARLRLRLDDLNLKEKLAQLQLKSLSERDLTIYDKELAVQREELLAAGESVIRYEAQLTARDIIAPISGQVVRYEFVIGELVRPDTVLMELYGGNQKVLKLRVAERYATKIARGQKYEAELAPYRGLQTITFAGDVSALRNVIQSEGRDTYRVAYCSFEEQGLNVPPGTTAEARIYYGRSNFWYYLFGLD